MDYVLSRDIHLAPSPVYSLVRKAEDNMLPYQWEALNDRLSEGPKSYSVRNLRAAAGEIDAPHAGAVFQDSDLFKWIEAAAYALKRERNEELEKKIDWLVALMRKAQLPDGYLDTYYILTDISKRFTNLRDHHELYCLGHLIEAAVAYYEATDKKDILDVTLRYVELVNATFGFEEGKKQGYPGHEEIELALVKLYRVTRDPMHLDLAKYFISVRGTNEYFDEEAAARGDKPAWAWSVYSHRNRYYQADEPVAEMTMAKGHSVRQLYLLTGMAELAYETGDEKLKAACDTMWKDITRRQMYITGAVGQSAYGEAFTLDYDLPSDLVYGETCAAISLYFFASAM
ncbi:MAG: glycoside hydrolase family 127 protein, partial [Clostridia bacterium]|nr:glycoside hydrolase family 127 protein [Clostridia bacterium]